MIRPQSKRVKELQASVAAVKKGDEVTTAGGIVGKVTKVEDLVVEVEIATGVKVKIVKSTLAAIAPRGTKPANDSDARFSALEDHVDRRLPRGAVAAGGAELLPLRPDRHMADPPSAVQSGPRQLGSEPSRER